MSKYQDKLDKVKAEDEACFDHVISEVNRELDIIKYTGNFEFCERLKVCTLLVYLDSKIVSSTFYRNERFHGEKEVPFWPMDILKRIPRATQIKGGGSGSGEYYASILHGDPDEWPELDYIPKIPEPPKPWWKFGWLW